MSKLLIKMNFIDKLAQIGLFSLLSDCKESWMNIKATLLLTMRNQEVQWSSSSVGP